MQTKRKFFYSLQVQIRFKKLQKLPSITFSVRWTQKEIFKIIWNIKFEIILFNDNAVVPYNSISQSVNVFVNLYHPSCLCAIEDPFDCVMIVVQLINLSTHPLCFIISGFYHSPTAVVSAPHPNKTSSRTCAWIYY